MSARNELLLFLLSCLIILPLPACGEREVFSPPNLLLITIDTLRFDRLGCTGREGARTPILDRLAKEGVLLDCMIVTAPITLPSHASIMTGLYPFEMEVRDNRPFSLSRKAKTLAEILEAAGYATAAVVSGEPLAAGCGLEQGFHTYRFRPVNLRTRIRLAESPADRTTADALKVSEGFTAGKPFFLWVHYFDPHFPYEPPERYGKEVPDPYDGEVAFVDRQIGVLLDGLQKRALLGNTLAAITADHGEGLGDHGETTHAYFLYDTTIRVPLIVKGPGVAGGRRSSEQVRSVDLMDALLLLLACDSGTDRTRSSGAADLAARLAGEQPRLPARPVFVESLSAYRSFRWAQMTSLRTGDRKLIRGSRDEIFQIEDDPYELSPHPPDEEDGSLVLPLDRMKARSRSRFARGNAFHDPLPGYFGGAIEGSGPFLDEQMNRDLLHPPDQADALKQLLEAVALSASGRTNRARVLLEELVKTDPENPSARYWRARILREQGEAEGDRELILKAAALFRKVSAMDPGERDAFHMRVWCLIQAGVFDEARAALDAWAEEGPATAKTLELYGYLHATRVSGGRRNPRFDQDQAFRYFDDSLERNKNNRTLLQWLIGYCKKQKRMAREASYRDRLEELEKRGWR